MPGILLIAFQILFAGGRDFDNKLRMFLDSKFAAYESYEYEIAEMPKNISGIEIDENREIRINKSYAYVPVKFFYSNSKPYLSFITLKVKLFKKVLVANQQIGKGGLLSSFQFDEIIKDAANIKGTPLDELGAALICKTNLKVGMVLIREYTEAAPDVEHNERLILHSGKNGVDVSLEVTSREKGKIGEVIRVVSSDKKKFKAKLIDKYNAVLID
ncbi:MAG: flagella basal body P-ring formation protein FlgA [Ignavibacteriales bacterium]|nr:flagella basal body P-ring formation protein FlgA [Ignavibacteriales bacterium]